MSTKSSLLIPLALATVAGLGALVAPGAARATAVVAMDLNQLAREATQVVAGRVTAVESFWDAGRIRTRVTLSAGEVLKGPARVGADVVFETLGGEVGGIGQWVPGEARFTVDEPVLVFLVTERGRTSVLGLAQGKWSYDPKRPALGPAPDPAASGLERLGPDGRPAAPLLAPAAGLEAVRDAVRGTP